MMERLSFWERGFPVGGPCLYLAYINNNWDLLALFVVLGSFRFVALVCQLELNDIFDT